MLTGTGVIGSAGKKKLTYLTEPLELTQDQKQNLKDKIASRNQRDKLEILIVEDMPFSLKLLEKALKGEYICYSADDIVPALSLYAEYAPDICFLDIDLPEGTGHDLASFINEIDPECYIIMVSANDWDHEMKIAEDNKVKDFIAKPYVMKDIYKSLDNYFINREKKVK